MYNNGQNSTRSPSGSRTDSYDHPSNIKLNGRPYQARSSITEETPRDDNEYTDVGDEQEQTKIDLPPPPPKNKQYTDALRYRFHNRPVSDYSYSAPPGPKIPVESTAPASSQTRQSENQNQNPTSQSGPYSSTVRPNTTGGTSTPTTYEERNLPKPVLRRVNPDQQNTYARSIAADLEAKERARTGSTTTPTVPTTTPAATATTTKPNSSGYHVRINEPNNPASQSITAPSHNHQLDSPTKTQLSIFEKVHSQGGPVSYLGTATFPQFENCLRQCLERERQQTGCASQIIREDIPASISALPYGYDRVSSSPYPHSGDPVRVHTFDDYPSRPTSTYTLDDIRYINAALSRSGIPLFPYHDHSIRSYSSPSPTTRRYRTGDIVSACQIADDDPAMLFSRNGTLAVHNVWNAIRNCRGPYDY